LRKQTDANNIFIPIVTANAIRFFLGLGLPWTILSIYQYFKERDSIHLDEHQTNDMVFALATGLIISVSTFLVLGGLRILQNSELGGSKPIRIIMALFLVSLWVAFAAVNIEANKEKKLSVSYKGMVECPG